MTYRLPCLVVAGILGFVASSCSESTPDPSGPTAGTGNNGGSSGSGGTASGGSAGAGGSATAGGGMGGSSGGAGGGGAGGGGAGGGGGGTGGGATGGGGAGGTGGGGGGGGSGGSGGTGGGSAHGTKMSFFVTSEPLNGTGKLGGLAGADAHCKALATAAGAVRTQWVAYLSIAGTHAKDRIGSGPWYNYDEEVFAADQAALHALPTITPNDMASRNAYIAAKPDDDLFMDENGMPVPGNQHDILTGSNPDGTVATGSTCMDWTSDSADGAAMLGHSDTPGNTMFSPSWNAAHVSQGCDAASLVSTGGEGRLYCFATD